MSNNFILRAQDITVVLGTSFTIDVQTVQLDDYAIYVLLIGTAFPAFVGTEQVFLTINGVTIPLIDNAGNIVVAGKLRDGKLVGCGNIKASKYRLQYGSNGMAGLTGGAIPHFVVHDGLCPMLYNGTAGSTDNVTPVE